MTAVYTGAVVSLPAYGVTAPADIFRVGDALMIRFSGDPRDEPGYRDFPRPPTHVVDCNPPQLAEGGGWKPSYNIELRLDLGIVVVRDKYVESTKEATHDLF